MPATFSINVGTIIESTRKENIFSVLQDIPDNTQKLISPRDVRDAFLSSWSNSTFKLTTPSLLSTSEYIGIDSGNPNDRDIKKRILIGKRSFGNLDVMDSNLLSNSGADIYFYNTKDDSATQSSTKIAILAGTDSTLHQYAPYIEAVYSTSSNAIDLNLYNPSLFGGDISILSSNGRVAINGILFPTVTETSASASNGKILRYFGTYPNGSFKWDDTNVTIANIGSPGSPTNIYGSPVNVNGYPLEFVEDNLVPVSVGNIPAGFSFSADSFSNSVTGTYSDWPIVEVIREILYPYVQPVLSISGINSITGNTYSEVGVTSSVTLTYQLQLFARESSEYISDYLITSTTYSVGGLSFSGIPGSILSGTADGSTYSNVNNTTIDYVFAASDNGFTASSYPFGFSHSATSSITFISPFLGTLEDYGTVSDSSQLALLIGSSTASRLVTPYPGVSQSVSLNISGSGYLYFLYPYSYPELTTIKDPNGFIIHDSSSLTYSAFTYSSSTTPGSPYTYYSTYRIYRTTSTCSYVGVGNFEFTF
jgi:hypothetical protein